MKKRLVVLVGLLLAANLAAQSGKEVKKDFDAKERIRIKLSTGDCIVKKSADAKIHVQLIADLQDKNYTYSMDDKGKTLKLEEQWRDGHAAMQTRWTIEIPGKTEIDANTGTGDLEISGVTVEMKGNTGTGDVDISATSGELDMNSGTGDIDLADCNGEFKLNSGTGSVMIKKSKGDFKANSGTGDVKAVEITVEDDADFNSGTGDVEVTQPTGENFDMSLNSGTGDAVLNLNGIPPSGFYELVADKRRGEITSSFKFDIEEEFGEDGHTTMRKTLKRGGDTPRYKISTGTGTAKLVK